MTRLRMVPAPPDGDEPHDESYAPGGPEPLRQQVNQIVGDHRNKVIGVVRRWILYWVRLGARQLALDECPGVAATDRDYIIDWLRSEGFTVYRPRVWGRVIIDLQVHSPSLGSHGAPGESMSPGGSYGRPRRAARTVSFHDEEEPTQVRRGERRAITQTLSGIKKNRRFRRR